MKILALFFLAFVNTLCAHTFDPIILTRASINGDVPNPNVIEMKGKWNLSLAKALKVANFDIELLRSTARPYPYVITVSYIADRTPDIYLDVSRDFENALKTKIRKGGDIQVICLESKSRKLADLNLNLNKDWQTNPDIAFQRLQQAVQLELSIDQWRQSANHTPADRRKKVRELYLEKLTESSKVGLVEEVFRNVDRHLDYLREKPKRDLGGYTYEEYKLEAAAFARDRIIRELSWIPPRF